MKTDELYDKWLACKQGIDVPKGWADSMMQRINSHEESKQDSGMDAQAWVDWLCACLPARAALVLAGVTVCVTRFVVLFLAVLG
jgi:hypothetical protein